MRSLVVGGLAAAVLFSIVGAKAAEPSSPSVAAPQVDWNGAYAGFNVGGATGSSRWRSASGAVDTGPFGISGGLFGVTAGWNFQAGQWVAGFEGDFDGANINGNTANHCGVNCQTADTWLATVRGRLGLAFDRWLVFGTAGLAAGDIRANFVNNFTGTNVSTNVGWAAGLGAEYRVTKHWSVEGEWLHADLGSSTCIAPVCVGPGTNSAVPFVVDIFRVGANAHF